ncbi:MAG: hypothetical protein MZW92_43130 [Comamonadaceae bacterium]|nr:hypothetical protein [Comamonadaceae bacterium]
MCDRGAGPAARRRAARGLPRRVLRRDRHRDRQSFVPDDRRQRQRTQDGEGPAQRHDHLEARECTGLRVPRRQHQSACRGPRLRASRPRRRRRGTPSARSRTATTSKYKVKNRNDAAVTLYYNVKVCRKGTENCWTLDPAIMNEP